VSSRALPAQVGNVLGAFADGAILFPLLASLTLQGGFSAPVLLATAGAAYLASGALFRVPMSVQPLKSIAIAGLARGASHLEVQISGALLGLFCLGLSFLAADQLGDRVPIALVHALQAGLGILLVSQGVKSAAPLVGDTAKLAVLVGLSAAMLIVTWFIELPVLGLVATGGLAWAVFTPSATLPSLPSSSGGVHLGMIAALVFPQLALTLGNSVIATRDVARRYFGARAERVTIRRLLQSIGVGNLLTSAVGGLPYCHGSGGLTAHVKGGATRWTSNVVVGATLLAFAAVEALGGKVSLDYPRPLLGSMLITIGVFHLFLATPTWATGLAGKVKLFIACGVAAATQNMLYVLVTGIALEAVGALSPRLSRGTP
jgi:sulfate permease, SulP family